MRHGLTTAHRAGLYLLVLALVALALVSNAPSARAEGTGSPIADAALRHLGTHGGQCWTFMRQVVAEATGLSVGYDYRQGYFDAGAVEVSAAEATTGDIIQIAADGNTSPGASYPGLHTAIILENLGGGVFNAVDSNQNWDEMVRLRPNYDPYAAAARYGLDVHIYRMPQGSAAPTVSWDPDSVSGTPATVSTGGDCLYLRDGAGIRTTGLGCIPDGTSVVVTGAAVVADGYSWVPVSTSRGDGWMAAEYLSGVEVAAAPAPAPVVSAPAPPPQTAASSAGDYVPSGWIHTDNSPGCLRLRDAPGAHGSIVECLEAGTAVRLVDHSSTVSDGYVWVHVETESGYVGYVASEFLVP